MPFTLRCGQGLDQITFSIAAAWYPRRYRMLKRLTCTGGDTRENDQNE